NGDAHIDANHIAATAEAIAPHSPATHTTPEHPELHGPAHHKTRISPWWFIAAALAVIVIALSVWRYQKAQPVTALTDFWSPVLHAKTPPLLCPGGVVLAPNNFSGVITAGKDIESPFVSFQTATAIARLSGLIERNGATVQLQSSPTTPLTELRERPVILLG